jgi:hypothetical protein
MDNMVRKEVLLPAFGWIASGIICLTVWKIEFTHPTNTLYLGIFVILVGIALLLLNKRIGKLIDKYKK